MGARHSRLAAGLAAAWEAELISAKLLSGLADRTDEPRVKARLLVLSAFCRAHASRLISRLSAMGRGPLPVVPDEVDALADFRAALIHEAAAARVSASRYEDLAEVARGQSDLSSAWVCELNRAEELDRARELSRIADGGMAEAERREALP